MKKIILIICMMFLFIPSVCASENTLQDIADTMKKTEFYHSITEDNSTEMIVSDDALIINYVLDNENKTLKFDYANDVISWKFTGDKNDESDIIDSFNAAMMFVDMIISVGVLEGYDEEQVLEWLLFTENEFNWENDGLEITTFDYDISDEGFSMSGETLDAFRMDINRFTVGDIDVSEDEELEEIDKDLVANIEILEIGTDYVKFKIVAPVNDKRSCYLYRNFDSFVGTSYSGETSIMMKECNTEFIDDDLEPGKTYEYKTKIEGSDAESEVITVTTKSTTNNTGTGTTNNNNNTDKDKNVTVNPQTGFDLTTYVMWVLLSFAVIYIVYVTKKYLNEN